MENKTADKRSEARCRSCTMTREERMQYKDGCPMVAPELGCPFYDRKDISLDKQEKVRIPWDIDLDLTLLEPLLIRCGRCLQKYSLSPRDDQEHLTHLYECPHCHQPLDSRAWLYAVRNLQKLLRQVPSARGDIELDAKRWRKLKACVLLPNRHKHRLTVSDFRSPPLCDLDRELDAISDDAISQYVNSLSSTEKK